MKKILALLFAIISSSAYAYDPLAVPPTYFAGNVFVGVQQPAYGAWPSTPTYANKIEGRISWLFNEPAKDVYIGGGFSVGQSSPPSVSLDRILGMTLANQALALYPWFTAPVWAGGNASFPWTPRSVTAGDIGPIGTLGSITAGSSYTDGTYFNVPLTGGGGTGASATVTVAGGAVTTVVLTGYAGIGTDYAVGDTLSALAASIGGTGSGFSIPVASVIYWQYLSDYTTQLLTRYNTGPIRLIESVGTVNEPNYYNRNNTAVIAGCAGFPLICPASYPQIVDFAKTVYNAAKAVDPGVLVTSPDPTSSSGGDANDLFTGYLAAGGAPYQDVMAFHCYQSFGGIGFAANLIAEINLFKATFVTYGLSSKPIWDTECGYGTNALYPIPALQAMAAAKLPLVEWGLGVSRNYWYATDSNTLGSITSLGAVTNGGTGYASGGDATYIGVPLTGGSCQQVTANIGIVAGVVTSAKINNPGTSCAATNVLTASAANLGNSGGSGLAISIGSLVGLGNPSPPTNAWGVLWNSAGETPAGVARHQIANWMIGAEVSAFTVSNNPTATTYTSSVTRPAIGYQAQATFDDNNGPDTCSLNNGCIPSWATQYRDIQGGIGSIAAGWVNLTGSPLLFENIGTPTPPSWVLQGADFDCDFQNGRYYGCNPNVFFTPPNNGGVSAQAAVLTDLRPDSPAGYNYNKFLLGVDPRLTPGRGLLCERGVTNFLLNSAAGPGIGPVTQTTATLAAGTYTEWMVGAGSEVISGGASGSTSQGVPFTFTLAAPATVTVTVTQPVTFHQLENSPYGTSGIITAGATITRPLCAMQFATPDPEAQGSWYARAEFTKEPNAILLEGNSGTAINGISIAANGIHDHARLVQRIGPARGDTSILGVDGGPSYTYGADVQAALSYSPSASIFSIAGATVANLSAPGQADFTHPGLISVGYRAAGSLDHDTWDTYIKRIAYSHTAVSQTVINAWTSTASGGSALLVNGSDFALLVDSTSTACLASGC